ncbi:MAG: hypothetical protein ABFS03_08150, partial [Chloroflexota bacterium]
MIIIIPLFIYFLIPIPLLITHRAHIKIGYQWFIALTSAFLAWILLLISYFRLPIRVNLPSWQFNYGLGDIPSLLLDSTSWPYAIAVATIVLAVMLTDVVGMDRVTSRAWASDLSLAGFGLVAILAPSPMILLPAWVALDFIETSILLRLVSNSHQRERVIVSLFIRLIGIFIMLLAVLRTRFLGLAFTFDAIPPVVASYIMLAAGARLGVMPPHQAFLEEPRMRRGLGTILRLIPVAASLVLLTRAAEVGAPITWTPYLIAAAVVAALYGSTSWARAKNELNGRPHWILGVSTLAFIAAVVADPIASLAWGIGLLFSGSILFLMSYRVPKLLFPGILGLICISALPFSPSWGGMGFYQSIPWILQIPFLLSQIFLVLGYIRFAGHAPKPEHQLEPWAWIIYPLGLTLLPIVHFWVGWVSRPSAYAAFNLLSLKWWGGALAVGLAFITISLLYRKLTLPSQVAPFVQKLLSLEWLYGAFWKLYRMLGKLLASISLILEGEGGVLWALILL